MPAKVTNAPSAFLGAVKKQAKAETTYGMDFSDPPPGILKNEGRAQIQTCTIGVYKNGDLEGQKFLRLAASVVAPALVTYTQKVWENNGIKIIGTKEVKPVGMFTSQMYPLCANKHGDLEANMGHGLNELRRTMGDEDFTSPLEAAKDEKQAWAILDALCKKVEDEAPVIMFSTRAGDPTAEYPEPRTWQSWYGRDLEWDNTPPAAGAGMGGAATEKPFTADVDGSGDGTAAADDDAVDLDALAALADPPSGDADAIAQLDAMADALGITEEATNAASYAAVVELIRAKEAEGEGAEAAAEPFVPVLKAVYSFEKKTPKNPKKPSAGFSVQKIEFTVTAIDKAKETVSGTDNATKAKVGPIAWADLSAD